MKKLNFVLGMVFTLVLAWTSQSVAQDYLNDNRTLLEIGDEKVSVAEFMRVYEKNNLQSEVMDKKSVDEYLDLYINFKLKVKEAEDLGLDTVSAFVNELSGYRKQLTKPYFVDEEVNEELVREAYDRKQYDIRAGHILIRVDQNASPEDTLAAYNKAVEILEKAKAGEDFSMLAVEFSDDPSARDVKDNKGNVVRKGNKGDLGYFSVFDMVYPFETAAYTTPEGEISEPIRTRYGYHLIKVKDRKPAMGKAKVAHIYAKFPQQPTTEDSATLKERIYKAYEELESGTDFVEVVEKYSDDKASRLKGGQLPIFHSNKMVPEFIYQVSLIEDTMNYSEPFLTQYGWHIIRLIERTRPGTFEEEEEQIRERLAKDIRSHKSKQAVINKIKKDYRFKEYDKNKEKFFAAVDSSLLKQEWSADSLAGMDKKLFKIGKKKYYQQDFATFLEEKQKKVKANNIRMYLETSYDEFVDNSCIHYLDDRLETIYPDFGLLMKEYRDGILLFELTDQKVWSKAIEDTTGLEKFYAENKDNYMWEERLDATIYTIQESDSLDAVYKAISAGTIEEDLANHFNNDSVTVLNFRQDLFEEGENNLIDNVSWETGIYKNVDKDGNPVIIHVQEVMPPQHKELKEARGLVIADYQNHLEKKWINSLKEKYPVEVNEKVLSSLKE